MEHKITSREEWDRARAELLQREKEHGGRGVEFLMSYYPILDRLPRGRHEGDAFQTWLRRHDEYESDTA